MKKFIKITLFALLSNLLISSNLCAQNQKTVSEGSVIRVRMLETLDSKLAKMGDIVNLEATEPFMVDGITLIEPGAKVVGKVIEATKNKSMGRKGKLDFTIDYVRAKDGQNIPLSSNIKQGGKDEVVGVVAAAVLISPLALFIKGKSAVVEKGTEFSVYVTKSVNVSVK